MDVRPLARVSVRIVLRCVVSVDLSLLVPIFRNFQLLPLFGQKLTQAILLNGVGRCFQEALKMLNVRARDEAIHFVYSR